jgi:hypothetical protein
MTSDFTSLPCVPTLADDEELLRTTTFPHLIVRIQAVVYQRERIDVRIGAPAVGIYSGGRSYVQYPEPFNSDGTLSTACREMLIIGAQAAVRIYEFRICIVWSPTSCSYVETNAINHSTNLPSGGLTVPRPIDFQTRKTIEDDVLVEQTVTVVH